MGSLERLTSYLAGLDDGLRRQLEDASWQLHVHTGYSTDTCSAALLALAGSFGAALALALLVGHWPGRGARRRVPLGFAKALAPGRAPRTFWAGRWYRDRRNYHRFHYAITGTTRSGKSLLLALYLRSILPRVTPGSDRRIVLFDPKNELHAALFADAQVPVHFLLPSDARSSRWDLARDIRSPGAVMECCEAMVPEVPGDNDRFFLNAARELLGGVIDSLNLTHPRAWSLADVVHILERREYLEQVLGRTYATRSKLRFMTEPRTWANIEATIEATVLNRLRILAALWSRSQTSFSLADFVDGEAILVLGRDPKYAALLDPVNTLLFRQLFGLLLSRGDSPTRRTYLVLDELTVAGGEDKPLAGFKDVCERGASRGVVVTVAYQSYAAVKALYQEAGDAVLGQLQNQVFLRAGDAPTAEFAAKAFGKSRRWLKLKSDAYTISCHDSRTHTESDHYHEEDRVAYEKLLELPCASPEGGITGYWLSPPPLRTATPFHLPGAWVAANLPAQGADVEPYLMRPDRHQYLEPLSFRDLKRLRLTPPEEAGARRAAPPRVSPPPTPPPARPADPDLTGKLRRLIGGSRGSSHGTDRPEGHDDAPAA